METGQLWRQYVIAGIVNIESLILGYCMGWTSPVNPKFGNITTSPLDYVITTNQEAWIGSLLNLGCIFGPFIGGCAATSIGCKWGLLSSTIPLFIGWILIITTTNLSMVYAGRFFWGLAIGIVSTILPMYCAEIATDDSRGAIGSFLQVFINTGFLLVYIVGPYVSYDIVQYVGITITAAIVVIFFFMPESPLYYLAKDDVDSATKSLSKIRGLPSESVQLEIAKLTAEVKFSREQKAETADVFRGSNFKALYISCALLFFQQFCGINAVLFYMSKIFEEAGSTLDSSVSTIIIGAVQTGASIIAPFVVYRLGRRIPLLISSFGTTVGLGLLGMYFTLDALGNPIVESIRFLPILSLVLFIVTYCWGLGSLPWAIMSELLPIEVKAVAAPIATALYWFLGFLVTRYFSIIAQAAGMGSTFFIFGVCCVVSFFFALFVVPETKGKSFQEIRDILSGRSCSSEKQTSF